MIAQKQLTYREMIITAGGNLPEWWSPMEMSEMLGIRIGSLSSVLKRMIRHDELERTQSHFGRFRYRIKRLARYKAEEPAKTHNIFVEIMKKGHDEDFQPQANCNFLPTDAAPGSEEKIELLRYRVEMGFPLWHDGDRVDYSGLVGAVRPRD